MDCSKTLFSSSKFSWTHERISSKRVDSLGTQLQKVSPAIG